MQFGSKVLPRAEALHGFGISYFKHTPFAAETSYKLAERQPKSMLVGTNFSYNEIMYYTTL